MHKYYKLVPFRYKKERSILIVTVVKCRDLPTKDPNVGSSDPYVKLQLLPEKQHKVKTRVLRKTRNPIYDEDFTFYGINANQLQVFMVVFSDSAIIKMSFFKFNPKLKSYSKIRIENNKLSK